MAHFGYTNNNPGNIRPNPAFTWQGQIGVFDSGPSGKFLKFDTMVNGIRAVARLCGNYPQIFGVKTMREFFGKYAPVGDGANDPDAYAKYVAKAAGVDIDQPVDFTRYAIVSKMLPAMFRIETGETPAPYMTGADIEEGCRRAGNITGVPAADGYVRDDTGNVRRENLEDSRTMEDSKKGIKETVAAGAAGATGVIAALQGMPWYVAMPIALVLAAAIGLVVWRFIRIRKHRREDNEANIR